jgi:streptogramin lyase
VSDLAAGTEFAGYRLEALAGRGGMGVVYRATELALARTVAVKVMAPWLLDDDHARARFVREARAAASIEHPNVIPIYAAGEHGGLAYIAMRFVMGSDLRAVIRREGALSATRAARIVVQAAAALDAAHRAGLVHRDVKPANVLLDGEEHVYLTDFGLSRGDWSMSGPRPTESGMFVGTSDYVAPEQIRGGVVDARADIYSLGAMLFHALTGETPFADRHHEAILWAHLTERPPAASARRPGLPRELDAVIGRAMAKRPADRYPSAGDLGRAAVAAAAGQRVRGRERRVDMHAAAPSDTSLTAAAAVPRSRRRLVLPAAVAALAAAIALTALASRMRDRERGSPPVTPTASRPTPAASPRGPRVRLIDVGGRPTSVAATHERVWVLVGTQTRLVSISPTAGTPRRVSDLPRGGQELTVAGEDMYAVFDRPAQVLRLDAATGERRAASEVFVGPTRRIAVGLGGVWVTERSTDPTQPDRLLRLNPRTLATELRVPMPNGARDVVAGGGNVWVASRTTQTVMRVDPKTGAELGALGVGNIPQELAFAHRSVWSASDDDTVTRTPLSTKIKLAMSVPGKPYGIEIRGRDVWVTVLAANQLYRLDARTNEVAGQPVRVCVNPALLDVTASDVWTACVGDRRVARVSYR